MKDILRIYDRSFNELGVCGNYTYLEYSREFREAGKAEVTLPYGADAAARLIPDGYIRVPDGDMYIIKSVDTDMRRGEVRAEAAGLLSLFCGTAEGEEYTLKGDVLFLLAGLAGHAASNMPVKLRMLMATGGAEVEFCSGRSYLYDDLVSLCYLGNVGMKLEYQNRSLLFIPYGIRDRTAGTENPVIVSRNLGTYDSERYLRDFGAYKNVAVVSGAQKDLGGRYTAVVRSDGLSLGDRFPDSAHFDRQMLVNFTTPMSEYLLGATDGKPIYNVDGYIKAMEVAGAAALARCRPKFQLFGKTDGDASGILPGDMVSVRDEESELMASALAERVVTVYSNAGKSVRTELAASVDAEE